MIIYYICKINDRFCCHVMYLFIRLLWLFLLKYNLLWNFCLCFIKILFSSKLCLNYDFFKLHEAIYF